MKSLPRLTRNSCIVALVICGCALSSGWWLPFVLFDRTSPAYDVNAEYDNGKQVAWGPRPAKWLLSGDPRRSNFTGSEWYFRLCRSYCCRWAEVHGYALPPWPPRNEW